MDNYDIIKAKFDSGIYNVQRLCSFVERGIINKDEFKDITSYDYWGYVRTTKMG